MPNLSVIQNPHTDSHVGTAGTGVTVEEKGAGHLHQTVITFAAKSVATTDAGASGSHGSFVAYTFPRGHISILGAVTNLAVVTGNLSATGIVTGAVLLSGLGSVAAAADATLSSTEQDIIPSTSTTLSSFAGTISGRSTSTELAAGVFNATTTGGSALTANLNFATSAGDSAANDTLILTGTITITWAYNGNS